MRRIFRWNPQPARSALIQTATTAAQMAAGFMAERAKQYAPVDTGMLLRSIEVQTSSIGTSFHVIATAPYAQWVEFGHMAGSTFVAPNPFMRMALADTVREWPNFVRSVRIDRPGGAADVGHLGATFTAAG
jgi:hypothetical protein